MKVVDVQSPATVMGVNPKMRILFCDSNNALRHTTNRCIFGNPKQTLLLMSSAHKAQKPAEDTDQFTSMNRITSQTRMDSGVDILKQHAADNKIGTVSCTPSSLLDALTPHVSMQSRSEDWYNFAPNLLDSISFKPMHKIENPRPAQEERASLSFEKGDAFVYVREENDDKAVSRTALNGLTASEHEKYSSSNNDVSEFTTKATGENLRSRDIYNTSTTMRSHSEKRRPAQTRGEYEREPKINRAGNSLELPPIYRETKIISSVPDFFCPANLQSVAEFEAARSGAGINEQRLVQPLSLENKPTEGPLQADDDSDLFSVDTKLFLAGMIEPWTEGVNLLSDFHKFGPEAAAVAALGIPLEPPVKRTRGTPIGATSPKKKIDCPPETREKPPSKPKTSAHTPEDSTITEGALETEKKSTVLPATAKHIETSPVKHADSEAILPVVRAPANGLGAPKKTSTQSPRASLSLKTRRYIHPVHVEPPQQLVPARAVPGDEEWHRQRIVATLTMKELKKIFPPLVKQCLRRRRQQQQVIQQKVELSLRERPSGNDSKSPGTLETMLPAATSLVAPPRQYVHMDREKQQHVNTAVAEHVEGQQTEQR
ncbi:hypothetical protein BJ742DRAFT_285814 [Cladochytrium replicatum]|nr:hypothetical protein BJ742DRAFT_285814 [Cladochytrium replicatum]